jgi:hypothetical protein
VTRGFGPCSAGPNTAHIRGYESSWIFEPYLICANVSGTQTWTWAVSFTAARFQAIIHDFVMLNALADTNAARGAITLATDTLRTVLAGNN